MQSSTVQQGMNYRYRAATAIVFQSGSQANVVLAGRAEPSLEGAAVASQELKAEGVSRSYILS